MAAKLSPKDLFSLEEYSRIRNDFRAKVMAHKKHRRVALGDHVSLHFEDLLTMQYQVQEILRVEKVFEADGIQEELDAYNPLIPDGSNLKATMLIEYTDVAEREAALTQLVGVEDHVWMQVNGHARVHAIADEDLERSTDDKTAAVHFLRFELGDEMVQTLLGGEALSLGVSHVNYQLDGLKLPDLIRESLLADFDSAPRIPL